MPVPTPCARPRHDVLYLDGSRSSGGAPLAGLLLDCLAQGLDVQFGVSGASMQPFIRDGDIVQAAPARPMDLTPGTIVLAVSENGALLVHRITACRQGPAGILCRLRGDAHVAHDGWFMPEYIPGVVRCIHRGKRHCCTSRWTMRLLGRVWMAYADGRAWTLRAIDRLLRPHARTHRPAA